MKLIKNFLVMLTLMIPAIAYGQSTTNSIYIEQIGDGSTITIEQTGNTNTIGDTVLDIPFDLNGASQNITVTQDGNSNSLDGSIKGANITASIDTTGDTNDLDFDVGATAASGSTLDFDVIGSGNDVDFTQGSLTLLPMLMSPLVSLVTLTRLIPLSKQMMLQIHLRLPVIQMT